MSLSFTLYPGSSLKQTDIHNGSTHMHNVFIIYCVVDHQFSTSFRP